MAIANQISEKQEKELLGLDQLTYYELANGAYCFIGNVKDICDHVDALGIPIYYVLADQKFEYKDNHNVTKTAYRPAVFKVISNFAGRSISVTDDITFETVEEKAWFSLPKIPWELMERVDAFFRKIDEKYGVESIVLLTYDSEKTGADGWGVLIPKQNNTATACDYDPDSVADYKPDNVYIVGSIHSHPGMPAYASGTDHKDQADFDGIHITIGWQKSKSDVSEYHIEQQMGGKTWNYQPAQIFELPPKPEIDTSDVDNWVDNVSKKTYNTGSAASAASYGSGGIAHNYYSSGNPAPTSEQKRIKAPSDCPDPIKNIVIGVIEEGEEECPLCETVLVTTEIEKFRCLTCHSYLAFPGMGMQDIVDKRLEQKVYSHDLLTDRKLSKSVYFWYREENGNRYELAHDVGDDSGK